MSNLCNLLKRNSENKTKDNTVAKTGKENREKQKRNSQQNILTYEQSM